jgi:hypothetical protein
MDPLQRFAVYIATLAVLLLTTARWVPAHYDVDYPREGFLRHDPVVDPALRDRLASVRPDVVLLGNSMLGEGVDAEALAALLDRPVVKFGLNGAASAVWYLAIKNVVCAADPPPRHLVLFFRDPFLTWPDYRVDGRYAQRIESLTGEGEELLDRLAYGVNLPWPARQAALRVPVFGERDSLRNGLETWARAELPARLLGWNAAAVDTALGSAFADSNLDAELLNAAQLAAEAVAPDADQWDFATVRRRSFLPEIVALCRDRGVDLTLVRILRRRDVEGTAPSAAERTYRAGLDRWLSSRGVAVLDYGNLPLTIDHFGHGDHLNEAGRAAFTPTLARDLAALWSGREGSP